MPASVARELFRTPTQLFENYETLVGRQTRLPASHDNDRRRLAVVGALFGSYGAHLRYGVLSLSGEAPASYGQISCILRDVAVSGRVSFLEENSYDFAERHQVMATPNLEFPQGYRAVWDTRHLLGATKLEPDLRSGQTSADWSALLVRSDATDRSNEDFVEAQIFEAFNFNAVEKVLQVVPKTLLTRQEQTDVDLVMELSRRKLGA
jgi:hypothetical protein